MIEENLRTENNQNENVFETKSEDIKQLKRYLSYCSKAITTTLICWFLFFLNIVLIFAFQSYYYSNIFDYIIFYIMAIAILIEWVVQLIWCVKTLTLNNEDLKSDALLWGLLGLLLIPVIPIFIMRSKASSYLAKLNRKI